MIKNNYQSPRWTGEITDCGLPLTFDQYSVCGFDCIYCFSYYQRSHSVNKDENSRRYRYLHKIVSSVNVDKVKDMFINPDKYQTAEYIKNKMVMQWGGLSDPFCWFEKKYRVGLELIKFFVEIGYPISFSTKGTWFLEDKEYADLIYAGRNHFHFKISIITLDESKAKIIERGVPSPEERLEAIRKLSNMGVEVVLRLRPFILGVSDDTYEELINRAIDNGAIGVSTEFFCLEARASGDLINRYKILSKACGFDIIKFYAKHSKMQGYKRLNRKTKHKYFLKMQEICEKRGVGFWVSDAHFKELCDSGCCCGLKQHWNYSKGQFTHALQIAKEKGEVRFSDILPDMKHLENVYWDKAIGFNTNNTRKRAQYKGITMIDHLRNFWNNPKLAQSPYKYFQGVLYPDRVDENGDIVYKYKPYC